MASHAHALDGPVERVVELGGERYLLAAVAAEVLTCDTGLMGTQASHLLRRLTRAGTVRARRLAPKLFAYHEGDVFAARDRLLDLEAR